MFRFRLILLFRRIRFYLYFKRRGYLGHQSTLNLFGNVRIGKSVNIGSSVKINVAKGGVLIIGDNVHIGDFCQIEVEKMVLIGNGATLSDNVFIADLTHTFPVVDSVGVKRVILKQNVTIGEGTWIGRNTTVNPGVSVGARNIIASNSVVTKTIIAEDCLFAGQPACVIKHLDDTKV